MHGGATQDAVDAALVQVAELQECCTQVHEVGGRMSDLRARAHDVQALAARLTAALKAHPTLAGLEPTPG